MEINFWTNVFLGFLMFVCLQCVRICVLYRFIYMYINKDNIYGFEVNQFKGTYESSVCHYPRLSSAKKEDRMLPARKQSCTFSLLPLHHLSPTGLFNPRRFYPSFNKNVIKLCAEYLFLPWRKTGGGGFPSPSVITKEHSRTTARKQHSHNSTKCSRLKKGLNLNYTCEEF